MFINFNIYKKYNLTPEYLIQLLAIKQKQTEEIDTDVLGRFEELGYVSYTKGKKNQDIRELVRLSDKASKLLNDLSFAGASDEETEKIAEWIIGVYKNKEGGIVKNKTELKRRIQWFKEITQIKGNFLAVLIQLAMLDTYNPECGQSFYEAKKENPRLILSNMAENLLWMPASHFDKNYSLDKSPLYTYFEDNEQYVKQVWAQKLDEGGNIKK